MHPQAMQVMQRFVGTPLGQAVAHLLIAWLVLQPLWEVGQRTARDPVSLSEVATWVWRLISPGAAHAASAPTRGPAPTLPGASPLALLPDSPSSFPLAIASSRFTAPWSPPSQSPPSQTRRRPGLPPASQVP